MGERAVLYTLGFDLNAQHPYMFLVNRLAALGLLQVCGVDDGIELYSECRIVCIGLATGVWDFAGWG